MSTVREETPDSFRSYVALVEDLQSKAESSLWLRGCGKRAYCLIATLYRHDTKKDKAELGTLERQLMVRFRQRSIPLHNRVLTDEWDMLFSCSTTAYRTRLLDWTENPFVAFHFAVMTSPFSVKRKTSKSADLSFSSDASIWLKTATEVECRRAGMTLAEFNRNNLSSGP